MCWSLLVRWDKGFLQHLHPLVGCNCVSIGPRSQIPITVQTKLSFMIKSESPAVTQTVWFGGSLDRNRSRPSGLHKACCFGTAIVGNNAQISQICGITVQATSRLGTNELLTQKDTFLIHSFSACSTPGFSPNLLPFTEFHYCSLHAPLPSWYQNFDFITNTKFIIYLNMLNYDTTPSESKHKAFEEPPSWLQGLWCQFSILSVWENICLWFCGKTGRPHWNATHSVKLLNRESIFGKVQATAR